MLSRGEIEERARALFGEPNRRLSTRRELRFGTNGSVAVQIDGPQAGLWYSFEALRGGTLLRDGEAPDLPASSRPRSSSLLTWDSDSAERFHRITDRELCRVEDAFTRAPALRTIPLAPAHQYLLSRGIDRWPEHSVKGWSRAGIVYLARTASGDVLACQALPLTPDGRKDGAYWPDGVRKRTYAACRGWHNFAAVRFPGRGEPILCEGVETAASVWLATGRPVCACLGQAGLRALRIGRRLTIARDGDEPGSAADRTLAETLRIRRGLGQRVRVGSPPVGLDFNDVHQMQGLDAVRQLIRGAQ